MGFLSWLLGDGKRYRQMYAEYDRVRNERDLFYKTACDAHRAHTEALDTIVRMERERDVLNTQLAELNSSVLALAKRNLALTKFVPAKYLTENEILALEAYGHVPTPSTELGSTHDGKHGRRHSRSVAHRKADVSTG